MSTCGRVMKVSVSTWAQELQRCDGRASTREGPVWCPHPTEQGRAGTRAAHAEPGLLVSPLVSWTTEHPELGKCLSLNFGVLIYSRGFRENLILVPFFFPRMNSSSHPGRRMGKWVLGVRYGLGAQAPRKRDVLEGSALGLAMQQAGGYSDRGVGERGTP